MKWLDRQRAPGSSVPSLRYRRMAALVLFFLLATVSGPANLHAQDAAPTSELAPSSAPASAPAQPSVADHLINLIGEADPQTRRNAAIGILQIGSDEGTKALVNVLGGKNNEKAKLATCEAIVQSGTQVEAFKVPLLALLEVPDATLADAASVALGVYDDPVIKDRLEAIRQAKERRQLIEALKADMKRLYDLTPEADRAALLEGWLTHPLGIRRLTGLALIHEALKKGVEPPESVIKQMGVMLDDANEAIRQKLIETLQDLSLTKLEGAGLLGAIQAKLPDREASPVVRALIYRALGHLRDPRSIPVCIQGLEDCEDSVAAKAAEALGELAAVVKPELARQQLEPAVDGLLKRIEGGLPDAELRAGVIEAMASIADERFGDELARHAGADEPVPAIRQLALIGIGRVGDPARIELVAERLAAETDPGIREAAVEAIGLLGSKLEHLQLPVARLDAKAEPSAAVQQKAWVAVQRIFVKLAPADQKRFIESRPTDAIKLAAEAQLPAETRRILADRLLEFVTETGRSDARAALGFLEQLAQAVPANGFGPEWTKKLGDTRRQLQAATQPASAPAPR